MRGRSGTRRPPGRATPPRPPSGVPSRNLDAARIVAPVDGTFQYCRRKGDKVAGTWERPRLLVQLRPLSRSMGVHFEMDERTYLRDGAPWPPARCKATATCCPWA